jgi:antitoxin CptB
VSGQARLGKLRWRARRGTRELDRVLGGWLESQHAGADAHRLDAFEALLDEADPDLWAWLTGEAEPPAVHAEIVDAIRAHARA